MAMDNLYNIFQREKERVGNDFTVFYNKQKKSLQYRNEEGTLTVLFNEENGSENIHYRPANKENVGLGNLVQETTEYGRRGLLSDDFLTMPKKFQHITQDYQFNRDVIGVEKPKEKEQIKTKNNYERD